MRVFLGLPTAGSPSYPFAESLKALRPPRGCTDLEHFVVTGNFIPAERELIVEEALARDFDVVAMIDDDMIVPPDALDKLCAALADDPQTALVGALYYSRDAFRPMAVDDWSGTDTTAAVVPAFDSQTARPVDGVGFGCVVTRAEALRALEPPYFSAHVFIERARRRVRVTDEDYLLCERLRHAGYVVRLHGGVKCGHYDRRRDKTIPERWEDDAATAHQRMHVRTPMGDSLVEVDRTLDHHEEDHRPVILDYLRVD